MKPFILHPVVFSTLVYATSKLVSTGLTVQLNDVSYYVSSHAHGNVSIQPQLLQNTSSLYGFVPVAVLTSNVMPMELPGMLSSWATLDDVFQPAFLQAIILTDTTWTSEQQDEFKHTNLSQSIILEGSKTSNLPKGPYLLAIATGNLHPVYRLYNDFAGAFNEALLSNPDGTFQTLSAKIPGSATLTIGVPSRLYYETSKSKPLAGVRVAVKDIFSLAGVKRSNGNRAWYHLYPPSTTTGTAISRLMEAGAIIVGTQRVSQFATSEVATVDWVDYHSPFNPRGDGYQDASSSSSGAGASVASYEWLDAAVGTDTGGSLRSPAGVNGLFGNRPSHGAVSLDHTMPLSEHLDTAGFVVRDPILWDKLQQSMYGKNYTSLVKAEPRYPSTIQTMSYPDSSSEAGRLLNNFASALANHINGTIQPLNLSELWDHQQVSNTNTSLPLTLNITYPVLTGRGQETTVSGPFYADYTALHGGRQPFIDPAPLARWQWAANYSTEEAIHNKTLFMNWFNTEVLPPASDPSQCSSSLLLYPGKLGTQTPRNQYGTAPPQPYVGFSAARVSVFSECPDFVFPIGEVPSFSEITNHVEYFPVAVGVMAAKGCDGLLSRLAIDLVEANILKVPQVGGRLTGGPILY
ncbi:hypothetical protein INS49_004111 [Diaporthe citri]|uniref:uncharacterized protein n=1 Tax=Diaporthe citri TaxID=83186 RepID=UPI001C825DEB|nr:uncharacterized protein INS49_004111 [Diaporthe citri]KAG6355030.1 hypothetical protein INS49_004111 [Diaporthe citri]